MTPKLDQESRFRSYPEILDAIMDIIESMWVELANSPIHDVKVIEKHKSMYDRRLVLSKDNYALCVRIDTTVYDADVYENTKSDSVPEVIDKVYSELSSVLLPISQYSLEYKYVAIYLTKNKAEYYVTGYDFDNRAKIEIYTGDCKE